MVIRGAAGIFVLLLFSVLVAAAEFGDDNSLGGLTMDVSSEDVIVVEPDLVGNESAGDCDESADTDTESALCSTEQEGDLLDLLELLDADSSDYFDSSSMRQDRGRGLDRDGQVFDTLGGGDFSDEDQSSASYVLICNEEGCTTTGKVIVGPTGAPTFLPMTSPTTPWLLLPPGSLPLSPGRRSGLAWRRRAVLAELVATFVSSVAIGIIIGKHQGRLRKALRDVLVRFLNPSGIAKEGSRVLGERVNKQILEVGRLKIEQSKILGYGSMGTVVYAGLTDDGRRVAVKRMLSAFFHVASAEINLLCESDEHPNVVRYHAKEESGDFVYLALELCERTLADCFEAPARPSRIDAGGRLVVRDIISVDRGPRTSIFPLSTSQRLLRELLVGVAHLHSLSIVHRDLKPQNVLLTSLDTESARVKISDMGVAKKLDEGRISFSTQAFGGSLGWQAPEVLLGERMTEKIDVFSCGCVVFYVLSGGHHPFGDRYERELNIIKGIPSQFRLLPPVLSSRAPHWNERRVDPKLIDLVPEARDLVERMVDRDPERRPSAAKCLSHPFFWSMSRRQTFLQDVSDYVEYAQSIADEGGLTAVARYLIASLEGYARDIVVVSGDRGTGEGSSHESAVDWKALLDAELLADLVKFRRAGYDASSVCDLLRVFRNKSRHFRQLDPSLQKAFGGSVTGLLNYFMDRFPCLLILTYRVVREIVENPSLVASSGSVESDKSGTALNDLFALSQMIEENMDGGMSPDYVARSVVRSPPVAHPPNRSGSARPEDRPSADEAVKVRDHVDEKLVHMPGERPRDGVDEKSAGRRSQFKREDAYRPLERKGVGMDQRANPNGPWTTGKRSRDRRKRDGHSADMTFVRRGSQKDGRYIDK